MGNTPRSINCDVTRSGHEKSDLPHFGQLVQRRVATLIHCVHHSILRKRVWDGVWRVECGVWRAPGVGSKHKCESCVGSGTLK